MSSPPAKPEPDAPAGLRDRVRAIADKYCVVAVTLLAFTLLGMSLGRVRANVQGFDIQRVDFAHKKLKRWVAPKRNNKGFRQVKLPFFKAAGHFRVRFRTPLKRLALELYGRDCVTQAWLDGKRIYKRQGGCRQCGYFGNKKKKLCKSVELDLAIEPGEHLLAVKTYNVRKRDYMGSRDMRTFWIEHEGDAAGWRALAALCSLYLLAMMFFLGRRWSLQRFWIATVGRIKRYRFLLLTFAFCGVLRVVISPAHLTGDVSQATHLYVENLVHKTDWKFTKLDRDLTAAKHRGKSYMHKPPGLYYQYVPARLLFGYTHFYVVYLSRLPGFLGDFLIAYALYRLVRRRTRQEVFARLAVVLYLFAPGTFLVNAVIGRVDALPVAFLALALNHIDRKRFSIYFGLAALHKQLAVLVGPWLLLRHKMGRKVLLAGLITLLLMAPFLLDNADLVFERMTKPQLAKGISGLSWMSNLSDWGVEHKRLWASRITIAYFGLLVFISPFLRGEPHRVAGLIYVSFLLFARNVAEHYLLWAAPFLIAHFCISRRTLPLMLFGIIQMSGMLHNDRFQIARGALIRPVSLVIAGSLAVYVLVEARELVQPHVTLHKYRDRLLALWRRLRPKSPEADAPAPSSEAGS